MAILEDSKNRHWIGTDNDGIYILDNNKNIIEHLKDNSRIGFIPKTVMCIFEDSNGDIWLGSYYDGLYKINNSITSCIHVNLFDDSNENNENRSITAISEDIYNNLWIGVSFRGIIKYSLKTKSVIDSISDYLIPNNWVTYIMISRKNNIG